MNIQFKVRMLKRFQPVSDDSAELLSSVLDWAELTHVIRPEQRKKLLNEVNRRRPRSSSDAAWHNTDVLNQ